MILIDLGLQRNKLQDVLPCKMTGQIRLKWLTLHLGLWQGSICSLLRAVSILKSLWLLCYSDHVKSAFFSLPGHPGPISTQGNLWSILMVQKVWLCSSALADWAKWGGSPTQGGKRGPYPGYVLEMDPQHGSGGLMGWLVGFSMEELCLHLRHTQPNQITLSKFCSLKFQTS